MVKLLIIFLFLSFSFLNANENFVLASQNDVYSLPSESSFVKNKIEDLILNSKSEINIAMYNFSYKKFAKALKKASKNGVKVTVLFDKEKIKKDNKIYNYLKNNGIKTILSDRKMHLKVAIFDNDVAVLGSINWTKESFEENDEIILFTKDKKVILKLKNIINKL